ncbi:STAS domain-containing protein [Nonomuraea sp. LPB2021202275-12-8]|uniref:STAS domain-containing protein n=1 Tax=Nonomuraea sp. LPB2021202275-12-8 TaxID=3120159 RepID=UPI00300C1655
MDAADTVGALTPRRLLRITPLVDLAGLRIEGELDRASLPALTRALASMAGRGSFHVDLSGLVFCDIGGLRALLTAAAGLRDGHVLTLRSPSSQIRRLIGLTGWHETAGLRLEALPAPCPADRFCR